MRLIRRWLALGWMAAAAGVILAGCHASISGDGGGGNPINFPMYYSVAVGDLNGDGKLDIAACYSSISGAPPHPGYVSVYLQDPEIPSRFLPETHYSVGNDPVWIAMGDLNGDGQPDLVTADGILATSGAGSSTVSVLLQDGTGAGHFLPAKQYAAGSPPTAVTIGDINGDGRPDLVVSVSKGMALLIQNPSAPGTFLPVALLSLPRGMMDTAIADLNGDGKPDLVGASGPGVTVLLQNPAIPGMFFSPVNYPAGQQAIDVAPADLNGDGKLDLAVANLGTPDDGSTASLSILLQNPALAGRFLPPVNYKTFIRSNVVKVADLNGDDLPDVAVANTGGLAGPCPPDCGSIGSVSIHLQNPAARGTFLPAVNYQANNQVISVAIGDVNGDGKPDMVLAYDTGVRIRLQDPAAPGKFQDETKISE